MSRKRSHKEVDPASDEDQSEAGPSHHESFFEDPFLDILDPLNTHVPGMPEQDKTVVLSVFSEVWDEFDSWREGWNEDQLVDLGVNCSSLRQETSFDASELESLVHYPSSLSDDSDVEDFAQNIQRDGTRIFQIHTVDETKGGLDNHDLATLSTVLSVNETAEQRSEYDDNDPAFETYAPVNRSIFTGDDSDHLPFTPFADEIEEYSLISTDRLPGSECLLCYISSYHSFQSHLYIQPRKVSPTRLTWSDIRI